MTTPTTSMPPPSPEADPSPSGQGAAALVHTLKALFKILSVLIVIAFAYVLFSNCILLKENERAMVFHFGALAKKKVSLPGGAAEEVDVLPRGEVYFAWPAPVDYVKKIPADKTEEIVTYQFWPTRSRRPLRDDSGAIIEDYKTIKPGQDGYLLTGDSYIMHMQWSLAYRIVNPKRYYLEFYQDPDPKPGEKELVSGRSLKEMLRSLLEEAALAECASWSVEDVLAGNRRKVGPEYQAGETESLSDCVGHRLRRELQALDIGIEVLNVNLRESTPPLATVDAFNAVNRAAQEYDLQVKEAEKARILSNNEAEGRKARILAEAKAYRSRVVALVQAQGSYFRAILEGYEKGTPGVTLEARLAVLYANALRSTLQEAGDKYVVHKATGGERELRLNVAPPPKKKQVQAAAQSNEIGAAAPAAAAPAKNP